MQGYHHVNETLLFSKLYTIEESDQNWLTDTDFILIFDKQPNRDTVSKLPQTFAISVGFSFSLYASVFTSVHNIVFADVKLQYPDSCFQQYVHFIALF